MFRDLTNKVLKLVQFLFECLSLICGAAALRYNHTLFHLAVRHRFPVKFVFLQLTCHNLQSFLWINFTFHSFSTLAHHKYHLAPNQCCTLLLSVVYGNEEQLFKSIHLTFIHHINGRSFYDLPCSLQNEVLHRGHDQLSRKVILRYQFNIGR